MKKLTIQLMLVVLSTFMVFSCKKQKKDELSPLFNSEVCPLLSVNDQAGRNIQAYEYVQEKLIRIYSKDSIPTTLEFRYNKQNQVERMDVVTQGNSDGFTVNFFYDDKGNVARTTTEVAKIQFMENIFTLKENKISSVKTIVSVFGRSVEGNTRIEYQNDNVSKVYSSIDKDPEVLAFVGEQYDDKQQFNPKVYKVAALGFVGIANNFFSFFGKNNLVQGKIYDEKGQVDQKMNLSFIYDKGGLPMTSESNIEKNGKIFNQEVNYLFDCK
ncbi:hypothetical protein SAMN06298216_2898 [Spirosomataceae bacterium TFI 002]|nr:hypothetical protein SAMN06298216_2898 [Spirosomataceae bacterium TFI 002]